jgi:hypothetical protein
MLKKKINKYSLISYFIKYKILKEIILFSWQVVFSQKFKIDTMAAKFKILCRFTKSHKSLTASFITHNGNRNYNFMAEKGR